jgi:hypothetical protein
VALGGGLEVAHDPLQRHVEAEELLGEEPVGDLARVQALAHAGREHHVVDALVGARRDRRVLGDAVDVLVERECLGALRRSLLGGLGECLLEIHGRRQPFLGGASSWCCG